MAIVVVENGKVVLTFRDVANVTAARKKYPHLVGAYIVNGDYAAGTSFSKGKFTAPPKPAPVRSPESAMRLAIRDLADAAGPAVVAKIEAHLGARRS